MSSGRRALVVAALSFAALAAPNAAHGQDCPSEPDGYDTGGVPGGGFPDDPLFLRQWGISQVRAPDAWAQGALGNDVIVAVVDSGADLDHPDLEDKLLPVD